MAGEAHHRARDADVHLGGARLAKQADDLERGGAAYDRIVHQHDALALDDAAHRRELHLHAELAHRLYGLDESAPDILVLYQTHLIRDAALLGVAHGGAEARLRHADDYVGLCRTLAEQPPSGFLAVCMDIASVDIAVRTREIDVLHRTHPVTEEMRIYRAAHALPVEADDLAGTYVTDE